MQGFATLSASGSTVTVASERKRSTVTTASRSAIRTYRRGSSRLPRTATGTSRRFVTAHIGKPGSCGTPSASKAPLHGARTCSANCSRPRSVQAIILAAGAGSRLRPLTELRPKCMVELAGVALLERQLVVLQGAGIDDVTVVVGAHAEAVDAPTATLVVNSDWQRSNMVTSLLCARETLLRGDDVVITYGDIAYEPRVLEALLATDGPVAVVVDRGWQVLWQRRFADPLDDAETLRLRRDNTIAEIGQRPGSLAEIEGQYTGLIKIAADAAPDLVAHHDRLAASDANDVALMYMTDFIQSLIDSGWPVNAALVDHGWIEIDTPADTVLYESGALHDLYDDSIVLAALNR